MGNLAKSLVIIFCLVCILSCQKQQKQQLKRYQIEHGYIRYKTNIGHNLQEERLYFDNWGTREVKYTDLFSPNGLKISESITITTIDSIYTINPNKKQVICSENASKHSLYKFTTKELESIHKELLEKNGATYIGSESIQGKKCKKWFLEDMNTTLWIWKGITLKTKLEMDSMTQEITADIVDEDFIPNDSFFDIPKDYEIRDVQSMLNFKKRK